MHTIKLTSRIRGDRGSLANLCVCEETGLVVEMVVVDMVQVGPRSLLLSQVYETSCQQHFPVLRQRHDSVALVQLCHFGYRTYDFAYKFRGMSNIILYDPPAARSGSANHLRFLSDRLSPNAPWRA